MSRLFLGQKDIHFFDSINKELLQQVIRQKVLYFSVSDEHTKTHRIYDEAVRKTVFAPVEINALISYNNPVQTNNSFSIDTIYTLEAYFHVTELRERQITPREGDFIKYGNIVYEIEALTKPQQVLGLVEHEVMFKAVCRVSRNSQFKVLDEAPVI